MSNLPKNTTVSHRDLNFDSQTDRDNTLNKDQANAGSEKKPPEKISVEFLEKAFGAKAIGKNIDYFKAKELYNARKSD